MFNLGVELGRYIEQNKLEDVSLDYFTALRLKSEVKRDIATIKEQIDKIAKAIVRIAFNDQISIAGEWKVTSHINYSDHKFELKVAKKYGIQVSETRQVCDSGDFEIYFELIGGLAKSFKKHNISSRIFVGVTNRTGDTYEIIYGIEDIEDLLYNIRFEISTDETQSAINNLNGLLNTLSKQYLLLMLSNTQ